LAAEKTFFSQEWRTLNGETESAFSSIFRGKIDRVLRLRSGEAATAKQICPLDSAQDDRVFKNTSGRVRKPACYASFVALPNPPPKRRKFLHIGILFRSFLGLFSATP
jgi:hypothetical protein